MKGAAAAAVMGFPLRKYGFLLEFQADDSFKFRVQSRRANRPRQRLRILSATSWRRMWPKSVIPRIHTRFPPEPNGYLHIGHAKSICLNFGIAREFGGVCNLRMDDTNPTKEDVEYVDSIIADVKWLIEGWADDRLGLRRRAKPRRLSSATAQPDFYLSPAVSSDWWHKTRAVLCLRLFRADLRIRRGVDQEGQGLRLRPVCGGHGHLPRLAGPPRKGKSLAQSPAWRRASICSSG